MSNKKRIIKNITLQEFEAMAIEKANSVGIVQIDEMHASFNRFKNFNDEADTITSFAIHIKTENKDYHGFANSPELAIEQMVELRAQQLGLKRYNAQASENEKP